MTLRCREARPGSSTWNVVKTLGDTVLIWSVLLVLAPALIYWVESALGLAKFRFVSPGWRLAGVVLFVAGGSLFLTSGITLAIHGRGTPLPIDCARELVVAGPYRYVRNPMTIACLAQGAAVGLYLGSGAVLAYVVAGLLLWNFVVLPAEEADLERRFGEAYCRYRRRVRRWRPRLEAYDPRREAELPPIARETTAPPGRLVVLYDGQCAFCRAQVRNLARLAPPGAFDALDFQQAGVLERFPGIPYDACMRNMHLVTPEGRVYFGFEAAVHAVATRPVLGLLAYAYYLPGIRLACDFAYAVIAANRYRLMRKAVEAGQCEGGTCRLHFPEPARSRPPAPSAAKDTDE
jgi:protein-S-isoprenylcysteine O-methyltransferase Ste14/predicted DCC family thiol-disulfide oxidoreductase YuxK